MASTFPDLYEICKSHLADLSFENESEAEFTEWVRLAYIRSIPSTHQIPTGFRKSVEEEIDQQITQWLRVTLYGRSLSSARR